jgi:hypothetical protein
MSRTMIEWPSDDDLPGPAQEAIAKLKSSAAAEELERDAQTWRVVSWPWVPGPPWRVNLRSDAHEEREWWLEADGNWHMRVRAMAPHIRLASDLAASLRS